MCSIVKNLDIRFIFVQNLGIKTPHASKFEYQYCIFLLLKILSTRDQYYPEYRTGGEAPIPQEQEQLQEEEEEEEERSGLLNHVLLTIAGGK